MNKVINKFLLPGDKFMPKCIQDNLDLFIALADLILYINKE